MHLHEEYIQRNGLSVPLVRSDSRSTVFLQSNDSPGNWRVVTLRWVSCDWHPGHYNMRVFIPVHNGYRATMLALESEENIHWDRYEKFMLDYCTTARQKFRAVPSEEKALAAWQIFLLVFDSRLAATGPGFLNLAANSISPENTLEQRALAVQAAKAYLSLCDSDVLDHLRHQIVPLTEDYADWLVRLVNG